MPDQQSSSSPEPAPVPAAPPKLSDAIAAGMLAAARTASSPVAWQPPSPAALQRSFPLYEIRGFLGRGGMGAVYLAWQKSLERSVAMKILPPGIDEGGMNFVERFKQEGKAMAQLKHPGIVTVFDAGEAPEGLLYFIMEYVEGTDVAQLLAREGKLPPPQALGILHRVCEALEYAHTRGIIHRDIKPSNVMIDSDGTVKVADFGLAKLLSQQSEMHTRSDISLGTTDYIPPEILNGAPDVDQRADVYAVGVMLYQMLTGKVPRGRFDPPSVAVPGLDKRLDRIVDKAMQAEREKRYASAAELQADLERIVPAHPPISTAMKPPKPGPRPRSSARRVASGILVAALLLIAAVAFGLWKSGRAGSSGRDNPKTADSALNPANTGKSSPDDIRHRWRPVPFKENARMNRGVVHLKNYDFWSKPQLRLANAAVRATIVWQPSPPGRNEFIKVNARWGETEHYYACLHGSAVEIGRFRKPDMIPLKRWSLEPPPAPEEAITLQLACVGHRLAVWVRDRLVGTLDDETLTAPDNVGVQAMDGHIRDFQFLDLDGLSDADAFRLLGLDARGSFATSGIGAASAVVTKEAPFVNTLGMKFVPVPISGGPTGGQSVLVSVWETREMDYEVFAKETGRERSKPIFEQGPTHPVVKVNWDDAQAFCAWLTDRERKAGRLANTERYRLPTDHEWSCAVGIGDREGRALGPAKNSGKLEAIFPWGTGWPPPSGAGNYSGEESAGHVMAPEKKILAGYRDDFLETAPVGSFAANPLGLFDLGGNVWEWCEDRWKPGEVARVIRGGSFGSASRSIASSYRDSSPPEALNSSFGFRVVITPASSAASPVREWAKVFPDLSTLPNLAEFNEGWARLSDRDAIKQLDDLDGKPLALRNGGVRAQRRVPENWNGGILLHVRSQDHGSRLNLCYYQPKAPGEKGYLQLRQYQPETLPPGATAGQAWDAQKLLAEQRIPAVGTEFFTELVVVGNTLLGRLGTHTVTCTLEDQGKAGRVAIDEANRQPFRDVEVLNLDGLSDTEARKVAGLAASPGAARSPAGPPKLGGPVSAASTTRWRDAFAEPPLKDVIASAERTPQGYRMPENHHWQISPRFERSGAVRVRAASTGGKFASLYIRHDDRRLKRVRFQGGNSEWLLTEGMIGAEGPALATTRGSSPCDGQLHDLLFARVGGRLRVTLDGQSLHDEPDASGAPGSFVLDIYQAARVSVSKVEYVDLHGIPEAEALKLLGLEASGTKPTVANAGSPAEPRAATKDAPFINSLGMKFVPVPIKGGPTDERRVLFCVWETRVQDYAVFAKETEREWPKPDLEQGATHPAVNVSWEDAQAFCTWLTERERKAGKLGATERYRLPSDHEWSCAVGIGDREDAARTPEEKDRDLRDVFPWGGAWPPPRDAGNYSGEEAIGHETWKDQTILTGYRDKFPQTAPVGSFAANQFGLFDLSGNAWEWCEDLLKPGHTLRVLRGASFNNAGRGALFSALRDRHAADDREDNFGFRVVLAVTDKLQGNAATNGGAGSPREPQPTAGTLAEPPPSTLAAALKNAPFTNSLGMKFVPVPITDRRRLRFSVWETRVQDYEVFAKETKREWSKPPFEQDSKHPAVGVGWDDAQAFCTWLTDRERKAGTLSVTERYRLPTDHEWSCAAGIGDSQEAEAAAADSKIPVTFPWGTAWPPPAGAGNYSGQEAANHEISDDQKILAVYRDDFPTTAPAGQFAPNRFGLFDLAGNAWEWCEDVWKGLNATRVVRGGSFTSGARATLTSSYRIGYNSTNHDPRKPNLQRFSCGFRVVLAASPAVPPAVTPPAPAGPPVP